MRFLFVAWPVGRNALVASAFSTIRRKTSAFAPLRGGGCRRQATGGSTRDNGLFHQLKSHPAQPPPLFCLVLTPPLRYASDRSPFSLFLSPPCTPRKSKTSCLLAVPTKAKAPWTPPAAPSSTSCSPCWTDSNPSATTTSTSCGCAPNAAPSPPSATSTSGLKRAKSHPAKSSNHGGLTTSRAKKNGSSLPPLNTRTTEPSASTTASSSRSTRTRPANGST